MKVISVFNQKGGVGKTTTNINLCSYLAMNGYKVLTVDIDPQGNTTSGLGIEKKSIEKSMYDVMTSDDDIEDTIIKYELIDNFYIAPSSLELAGAEVEIIDKKSREFILKNKLEKIKNDYDYVFIDCPPSLGLLTVNSLCASQSVLIPIQAEFYALEGVGQLVNTIQLVQKSINKDIEIEGVVLTMSDKRIKLTGEVYSEITKYFKKKVYDTVIPRNVRLAEAPSFGLPILLYDEKCKGAQAYNKLSEEFLKRQKR